MEPHQTNPVYFVQLSYLESVGWETSVLMVEPDSGFVNQFGSVKSIRFLLKNENLRLRFLGYCNGNVYLVLRQNRK